VTPPCKLHNVRHQQSVPQGHAQLAAQATGARGPQAEARPSLAPHWAELACQARQGPRTRKYRFFSLVVGIWTSAARARSGAAAEPKLASAARRHASQTSSRRVRPVRH